MRTPFITTSFNFDKSISLADFKKVQSNNPYLTPYLDKNPNLYEDLYGFLKTDDKKAKTKYEVLDVSLNIYSLAGMPSFFFRETKRGSVVLYNAAHKMEYLEEIKRRKSDLDAIYMPIHFSDGFKKLDDYKKQFIKELSDFFDFDLDIKGNAKAYSQIIIYSVGNLLDLAEKCFKLYTPEEILVLSDNKFNLVKGQIEESYKSFHKLIKYVSLNHSPYNHLQTVKLISNLIDRINEAYFYDTYLHDVLKIESEKIANDEIYKSILDEGKLLEMHLKLQATPNNDNVTEKFYSDVFLSQEAQDWFFDTLEEMNAIMGNKVTRGFQAKCNAIFSNKSCKEKIFKYHLQISTFISFLNKQFNDVIRAKDKLSASLNHEERVEELIQIYLNR
ncbi:hypothetical protein [Mangrovimonas futianensis]|uniref:hypothetical protein n=1 Tax=Mangrovimonas futianensis TaxID=2895523 RepID=UPI001E64F0EA|nr:hypothetical protein [Mangrovimonas futianensis]MCF1420320.1 hypothetical protein [Mangrovimonas futianensis]